MATVILSRDAQAQYLSLPNPIAGRVAEVFERLAKWPEVSGAKPLRGKLAGHRRIRTGSYRVQFYVEGDRVVVERIGHRDGFYDD